MFKYLIMIERIKNFIKSDKKKIILKSYLGEQFGILTFNIWKLYRSFFPIKNAKVSLGDHFYVNHGKHRSGWSYAVHDIRSLYHPKGVLLDVFIERTFSWDPNKTKPHTKPWIGFIHVPPNVPKWLMYNQSNQVIFASEAWKLSMPYCLGLFTLSKYHKDVLTDQLSLPLNNLYHPTEFPDNTWSWKKFKENQTKMIIQIGWWLRKLYSIHVLKAPGLQKIFLRKEDADMDMILKSELENCEYRAHDYLQSYDFKQKLTGQYFRESLISSEIYRNLPSL